MKNCFFIAFVILFSSFTLWQSDFEKTKELAKSKHQYILLNFSGSDWCGPCMRMKKEIFDDANFSAMADTTFISYNADFPRSKSKQLNPTQKKQNNNLADIYNPEGKFPFTLLLDENGKVIKTWEGLPDKNVQEFTQELKNLCNAK